MRNKDSYKAKPFVKWVGGKTQLLSEVQKALPVDLHEKENITYVEPFVGGGAVLFWILQEYPNIERAVINDINEKLICTYRVIRDNVNALIDSLYKLQSEYIPLDIGERLEYYLIKRTLFNSGSIDDIDTAALFIFLNRTCFNGLYRVNSQGKFNVPHGKYSNPKICDTGLLLIDSELLQRVEILCGDFSQTGKYADKDSLFYFDPPYKPLNETSSFTSYSKEGFSDEEQLRLRDFCREIADKNALFVASNSDPGQEPVNENFFDSIYRQFSIKRVSATRMINANPNGRGKLSEILITNVI